MRRTGKAIGTLAAAMSLALVGSGGAVADDVHVDGDGATALNNSDWNVGTVCLGATGSRSVPVWVTRQGNGNVFADSAVVSVSGSTTGARASVESGTKSIPLPSNWVASPNNTLSSQVAFSVTYTAPSSVGSFSQVATFTATGANKDGGSLSRIDTLTISGTTQSCKQDQAISFTTPASPQAYGQAFVVEPTATSQLPVTVVASGACAINSGTVSMTNSTGDCILTASQGGNDSWNAATDVVRTVTASKRVVAVAADATSKTYGEVDPSLTYQVTSGSLVNGDGFTGSLTRPAGEAVGTYAIEQGSLALNSNYDLRYTGADLTIHAWTIKGFFAPIGESNSFRTAPGTAAPTANDSTVWQTAKGGSTIPLKFEVMRGAAESASVADIKGFSANKLSSCKGTVADGIEELASAGSSSLRYDDADGHFIQNWKTSTVSGDTCYRVTMTTQDGSAVHTFVRLRK